MNILPDQKPRLLLVDDQPANLHMLAALLKGDYDIQFAINGETALQLAANEQPPHLILLDVIMPDLSGIEVLRRLRQDSKTGEIPVILVSADQSEQNEISGLQLGADDYLTKPVQARILLARVRNILLRKRAEAQSRLAAHVFQQSGEAMMVSASNNRLLEVNPAFTRLTGYTLDEVRGKDPKFLALGSNNRDSMLLMWAALKNQGIWRGEVWNRRKDGSAFPALLSISAMRNRRGEAEFYIASLVDISEQKATEEEIRRLAHHDALTGLPNRLHLGIHLEQALALARRGNQGVALMFIDLDRFKIINDTLGHDIGDDLLVEVASRLRSCVRESDLVARLGGDEFVIVLHNAGSRQSVQPVVEKILKRLGQAYDIGTHILHSSPSIGVSLYPQDGAEMDALMKNADCAMYQAKARGRNNAQYFELPPPDALHG